MSEFRSGFVAVVGRPNVGKSTLINQLLGQKIASVSPRAQTTRRRQLGILSTDEYQIVFVDTPGLHQPHFKLGEFLNQEAEKALDGVDVILMLVDAAAGVHEDDKTVFERLSRLKRRAPLLLVLNKVDLFSEGDLPTRQAVFNDYVDPANQVAFSALSGRGKQDLLDTILKHLPERPPEYDPEQVTDLYEKEIAAELIREACLLILQKEVPHGINIRIDEFTERGEGGAYIAATVFVERESQKGIVIGAGGAMLKKIGSHARGEIEAMSGRKVFLELRVKVEKDWRDDENALRRFGYKVEKKKGK